LHQDKPSLQFNLSISDILLGRNVAFTTVNNNLHELSHEGNGNQLPSEHHKDNEDLL
jgi:hypothetical protein